MNRTEKAVLASLLALFFILTAVRWYQDEHRRVNVTVVRPDMGTP